MTVIAILLRHQRAREIAKTRCPCSACERLARQRAVPLVWIEAGPAEQVVFGGA
jgi:hypothetical protein